MVKLSPKLKVLIIVASVVIVALIGTVLGVVLSQKMNVAKIKSLSFSSANQKLLVGERSTVSISIDPVDAKNRSISFSSTNESVVRIVSYSDTKVTIQGMGIGEAEIVVQSNSNKKLSDTCHIVVSDNIAHDVVFYKTGTSEQLSKFSAEYGKANVIDVVASPSDANLQKISVVSYDATALQYAYTYVQNGVVQLGFFPVSTGTTQIVVGVFAESDGADVLVLSKTILIETVSPENQKLVFEISSSSSVEQVEVDQEAPILMMGSSYEVYIELFVEKNGTKNAAPVDGVSVLGGHESNPNLRITANQANNVLAIREKNSTWQNDVVVFEYQGLFCAVRFARVEPFSNGISVTIDGQETVQGQYNLKEGMSYTLIFSEAYQRVFELGIGKLTFAFGANDCASIENNQTLTCLKEVETLTVSISCKFSYWDENLYSGLTGGFTDTTQTTINVNIDPMDFVGEE